MKKYYIYILTNYENTILYIGVTNDLIRRVYEHKNSLAEGFTSRYKLGKLVYYEEFIDPRDAIEREKQLKSGSRKKKVELIEKNNSDFIDLYEKLI
jgi:putative endonuclease